MAACGCAMAADEFTLKSSLSGTDFDWSSDDSYEGGSAPSSAGVYVCIPNGMVAKLSAADETSWTFVTGKVARIRPMGTTSKLVVAVATANSPAKLMSEVTYTGENTSPNYDRGGMEKTGDGELQLCASGKYSYFTTLTISEGTLSLYDSGIEEKYYFDTFNVATNTTLNLIEPSPSAAKPPASVCRKFFGEGTINSRGGALQTISSNTLTSEFSGRFTGSSSKMLTVCSPIILSGTNSTASGYADLSTAGPLYVKSFGRYGTDATESSSVGKNGSIYLIGGGSGVVYLGEGETTDIEISLRSSSGINYIDAGATGGLTVKSKVSMGTTAAAMQRAFVLQGSNTVESVFTSRLVERSDANIPANYCPYHIVKRGTGTWRMAYVSNTGLSGGISVEEGTLKYDTIAAAGTLCALGYATHLYEAYTGTIDDSRRVDWAISLGTAEGTEGTIEYSGTSDVLCMTRPIALKGDGRIRQNVEKQFRFYGISSDGENAKTLTLDGSGTGGNEITGLSDTGAGAISVAKEGAGTWTLTASNSFRGTLAVNAGTLNVCAPNWSGFRFTDMQVFTNTATVTNPYYEAPSKTFSAREMAFFDADGVCRSVGLQFTNTWQTVLPGFFSYAKDSTSSYTSLYSLFDDTSASPSPTMPAAPMWNDESTWVPLVIRLPSSTSPVASFDMVWQSSSAGRYSLYYPMDFKIEGSVDGINWETLFTTNGVTSPGGNVWLGTRTGYNNGELAASATDPTKRHQGLAFSRTQYSSVGPLDSASSVFVATNCTLRSLYGVNTLRSFGIDMATGGGTVDGFAFSEDSNSTLTVVGVTAEGATASFTPVNCTGVANLSHWKLCVGGRETTKFRASVQEDGTVKIVPLGFRILIR